MSQDREMETYLQGKTSLSKLYADAPQIEPPDHLDAAILAEAHRAVGARPGAMPKRRWVIPLGLVASLFVVVMIGLQLPYMLKEAAPLPAPMEEKISAAMEQSKAERSALAQDESNKFQAMDKAKSESRRAEPAPLAAQPYEKPNAPAVAAPMAAAPAPASKRLEMRERADIEDAGALSKEKQSGGAEGNISDAIKQRAPASAGIAAPQPVQLQRALKQDEVDASSLSPEDWLIRIKKLKQEGKQEEAKKELAAFKKRYPDYAVPASLEIR